MIHSVLRLLTFCLNAAATAAISTLSLHDALPISRHQARRVQQRAIAADGDQEVGPRAELGDGDRKSTRLNSSHTVISYAVFCLKKKKQGKENTPRPHIPVGTWQLPGRPFSV